MLTSTIMKPSSTLSLGQYMPEQNRSSIMGSQPPVMSNPFSVEVVIENSEKMETAYIRTRHNNLRCFPQCGKIHKTKSFCGTPLYVRVKRLDPNQTWSVKELHVFGEFRNVRKPASFSLLSTCTSKMMEQSSFISGHLSSTKDDFQFTINPPRKWRYRARIAQVLDMHVFTIYVVAREVVIAIKDSPPFQVVPIWKADDALLRANEEGDDVEDDEDSGGEEDKEVDEANTQAVPGNGLLSPQKKVRSSLDDDSTAPPPQVMERHQSNGFRRDAPMGYYQDLKDPSKVNGLNLPQHNKANPTGFPTPPAPSMTNFLNGLPGVPPPQFPLTSNQMFPQSFFPCFPMNGGMAFNQQPQQLPPQSLVHAPVAPGTVSTNMLSPHSVMPSFGAWQGSMNMSGYPSMPPSSQLAPSMVLEQPHGMVSNGNGIGSVNMGGANGTSIMGNGASSTASMQNKLLSNLLTSAYLGGQPFSGLSYPQSMPQITIPQPSLQAPLPTLQPPLSPLNAEQINKAIWQAVANNMAAQTTGQPATGGTQNGFPSGLAGQTMHLASGKNAKEKHQD